MTDKGNHASTGDKSKSSIGAALELFRLQVVVKAHKVFSSLDNKLNPSVLIVGIPAEQSAEGTLVSLEPADDSGYQPEFFSGVMELANHLHQQEETNRRFGTASAENDQQRQIFEIDRKRQIFEEALQRAIVQTLSGRRFGTASTENDQRRQISSEAIQRAIVQILSESDGERGVVSYCSLPTAVGEHKVCCVLQLDAKAFNSHPSLRERHVMSTRFPRSLIDSAAVEFLKVCSKALRVPRAGIDVDALGREPEEILRAAGRELTFRAAYAGYGPMPNVFDALNIISSKHHEGEKAGGEMLLVTPEHPDIQIAVAFQEGVTLKDHDAARKILEMAQTRNVLETNEENKFWLLCTVDSIYGIGRLNKDYEREFSEIYTVRFTGHYSWELVNDDKVMMEVHYGHPSLPKKPIDKEVFRDHAERIFTTTDPDVDALWWIVEMAAKQNHGTMITISSNARNEAQRLAGQSTLIKPTPVNESNILLMLTSIDGAVLVDPAGICHAVGVILDGMAVVGKGTRTRGSRYNSAIRYIAAAEAESECLAVVISEDGIINLVPSLMPRIRRSEIEGQVEKAREAVNAAVVNKKQYLRAMDWLNAHRFYLSGTVCDELNNMRETAKHRLWKAGKSVRMRHDFTPNSEMNDSYFIE